MKHFLIMAMFSSLISAETLNKDSFYLIWQDEKVVLKMQKTWDEAKLYCDSLNQHSTEGWRLPSIKELQSIVDPKQYRPAIISDFQYTTTFYFWSSTEYKKDRNQAWYVTFESGLTSISYKTIRNSVRCVKEK